MKSCVVKNCITKKETCVLRLKLPAQPKYSASNVFIAHRFAPHSFVPPVGNMDSTVAGLRGHCAGADAFLERRKAAMNVASRMKIDVKELEWCGGDRVFPARRFDPRSPHLELMAFVSAMRTLSWFFESAALSLPARSMM